MIHLQINLDGDDAWEDLKDEPPTGKGILERITVLEKGTQSGKPTVAMLVRLEDGSTVFAETTYALFQGAARAFRAKYGEP